MELSLVSKALVLFKFHQLVQFVFPLLGLEQADPQSSLVMWSSLFGESQASEITCFTKIRLMASKVFF